MICQVGLLNGDKSGLATFQEDSTSDVVTKPNAMPSIALEVTSNLTSELRGTLADEIAKQIKELSDVLKRRPRGSKPAVKRKGNGLPTAPKIFEGGLMPEDISIETIPLGVQTDWFSTFLSTTPSYSRELLAISEVIKYFKSEGRDNCVTVIPNSMRLPWIYC